MVSHDTSIAKGVAVELGLIKVDKGWSSSLQERYPCKSGNRCERHKYRLEILGLW